MGKHSLLNRIPRPLQRGTAFNYNRTVSDDGLILRYCYQLLNFEMDEMAKLLEIDIEEMRKLYFGIRAKNKDAQFEKLLAEVPVERYYLLMHAHDWVRNSGSLSRDLPFGMRIMGNDGVLTEERYWFQSAWFLENFKDEDNVTVMKILDSSLNSHGFNRDDVVIVSRLPEHLVFRAHSVYMVGEADGSIYPRIGELLNEKGSEGKVRSLVNPVDKSDVIPFTLPEGCKMIGKIVWRSGLL